MVLKVRTMPGWSRLRACTASTLRQGLSFRSLLTDRLVEQICTTEIRKRHEMSDGGFIKRVCTRYTLRQGLAPHSRLANRLVERICG